MDISASIDILKCNLFCVFHSENSVCHSENSICHTENSVCHSEISV